MLKRKATEFIDTPSKKVVVRKTVGEIILEKIHKDLVAKGYERKILSFSDVLYIKPVITSDNFQTFSCFVLNCRIASVCMLMRDLEVYEGRAFNRDNCVRSFPSYKQFREWYAVPCWRRNV
jgi:imidazole glycerol phosphate synthase subunit HisF